jgi:hypothetical protein
MSAVLLLIVFSGFARSLYLRAFFETPPIPAYLYVHGAILTSWFVLFFVQTVLVSAGRSDVHRRLGIAVALFAVVVVAGSLMATLGLLLRGEQFPLDARIAFASPTVWTNIGSLVAFSTFVISAFLLRRRTEAHKRLMFLASFSIISPALARLSRWSIFGGAGVDNPRFGLSVLVLVLVVLALYDFVSLKRLHPATVIAGGFRLLTVVIQGTIASSEFGKTVVHGLGRLVGMPGA